jgi:hypothetical protein
VLWLGATAVGLVLFMARAVPGAVRWFASATERVAAARAVVQRQEVELRGLADLEARSDSVRKLVLALAERLVAGGTEAEAQAELLAGIEAVARRVDGRLEQLDPVPDSIGIGHLRRIQARAAVTGSLASILGLVKAIEWSPRLMLVRRLRIETVEPTPVESLRAELVVEGWFLRREGAAAE